MPELPEVETVRRGLASAMEGATITGVELHRPDLRYPFPDGFRERLAGSRVMSVGRRGKYLICELANGTAVILHLGMSGSFRVIEEDGATMPGQFHHPRRQAQAHDHVVIHLKRGGRHADVVYNDPRRFGFMDLAPLADLNASRHLRMLGIDPLGNNLSGATIARLFAGRKSPLKAALLDQRLIAGLGNIYACEALWESRLSPSRPAGSLATARGRSGKASEGLATAIRDVLNRAIAAGGSTLRDHRQTDGALGYFQHSFRVYGREAEPCQRPDCRGVIVRETQSGRSTFSCRHCQR